MVHGLLGNNIKLWTLLNRFFRGLWKLCAMTEQRTASHVTGECMPQDKIYETIDKIYKKSKKPLLLSTLGYELRKEGCAIVGGIKNYIETMDGFSIVQHPDIKEKIAISTNIDAEMTMQQILKDSENKDEANSFIEKIVNLPRTLLIAFCSKVDEDSYISTVAPYKFLQSKVVQDENIKLISKDFKKNIYIPSNIERISNSDAKSLYNMILRWCQANELDISIFQKIEKHVTEKTSGVAYRIPKEILLFIESQPEDVKQKIVIPVVFLKKV